MNQILFYRPNEVPYGCFSNFSRHPVTVYGNTYLTSEHAFQAAKHFHNMGVSQWVAEAETPTEAAARGRNRLNPMRPDWETHLPSTIGEVDDGRGPSPALEFVRDEVMFQICLAKFSQHQDLKRVLLGTGSNALVENSTYDPYWGWGCSRNGVNRLGKVLMLVRERLNT